MPEPTTNAMSDPWVGNLLPGTNLMVQERLPGTRHPTYRLRARHLPRWFFAKVRPLSDLPADWPERFARQRKMRSPHLVKLFRVLELEDQAVLVLDWASGTTLREELRSAGTLSPTEVRAIGRQLASALCELRNHGFAHGSIDLDHVMVERLANGNVFARLLDHGFALDAPTDARDSTASGDGLQLGCLLFELLTGSTPLPPATFAPSASADRARPSLAELRPELAGHPLERSIEAMLEPGPVTPDEERALLENLQENSDVE